LHEASSFHSELASVLAFLDAPPPSPERLACAPALAGRDAYHAATRLEARKGRHAFEHAPDNEVVEAFRSVPGLSCRLWATVSAHPSLLLLLRLLEYDLDYDPEPGGGLGIAVADPACPDGGDGGFLPHPQCMALGLTPSQAGPDTEPSCAKAQELRPYEEPNPRKPEPVSHSFSSAFAAVAGGAGGEEEVEPVNSEPTEDAAVEEGASEEAATEERPNVLAAGVGSEQVSTHPKSEPGPELLPQAKAQAEEPARGQAKTGGVQCGPSSTGPSSTGAQGLPHVAVIVSTTSRGVVKKGKTKELTSSQLRERLAWVEATTRRLELGQLVLFTTMLPSLAKSLECGFRYTAVVGFDRGDLLFDTLATTRKVEEWLREHLVDPARARGVECGYILLAVDNPLKKPGPVFNAMAASVSAPHQERAPSNATVVAAYPLGGPVSLRSKAGQGPSGGGREADFIYRVNDDTEFKADEWTSKFVKALKGMGAPAYGVVGPSCPQGNRAILTHDFTARSHVEIFGDYYPPVLTDWFMDDWISRVYGSRRTKLLKQVEVIHHSKTYGRRYDVDGKKRHLVDDLVLRGKQKVLDFMQAKGASLEALKSYEKDKFDHRQSQREVDQSTISNKAKAIRPPGH